MMPNHSPKNPPSVWLLTDDRPGNTTQSVGLAQALGWPYQLKALQFNWFARLHNQILGASILGVTHHSSPILFPPWPDIVIAAGRRTAPIAKWIKKKSQGHAKLVHLGRKGGDVPEHFDAVITPAYCRLPPHPRRIETIGPLTKITQPLLRKAATQWPNLFGDSPSPRIALLVGGATQRYFWNAELALEMGREVQAFAKKLGGTVYAVTSRRTGEVATKSLQSGLGKEAIVDAWRPNRKENPYLAYLALADVLIVTGDSESMLAEAVATDHPVCLYSLPEKPQNLSGKLGEWIAGQYEQEGRWSWFIQRGVLRPPRDLHRYHNQLIHSGRVQPFGASLEITPRTPLLETPDVARKVLALLELDRNS